MIAFLLIIFGTAGLTWFAVENNVSNAEQLYHSLGGTGVLVLLTAFVVAQPFMFIGAKKAAAWLSDRFDEPTGHGKTDTREENMKKTFNTILKLLMPIFAVFSCGTLIVGFTQPIDAVEQKGVYLVATLAFMGLTYLCWRWSSEPKNTL